MAQFLKFWEMKLTIWGTITRFTQLSLKMVKETKTKEAKKTNRIRLSKSTSVGILQISQLSTPVVRKLPVLRNPMFWGPESLTLISVGLQFPTISSRRELMGVTLRAILLSKVKAPKSKSKLPQIKGNHRRKRIKALSSKKRKMVRAKRTKIQSNSPRNKAQRKEKYKVETRVHLFKNNR